MRLPFSTGQVAAFFLFHFHLHHRHFWAELIISLIVLIPSLLVILSDRYSATQKHWAYGAIGTILGFWLGHAHVPKPK